MQTVVADSVEDALAKYKREEAQFEQDEIDDVGEPDEDDVMEC